MTRLNPIWTRVWVDGYALSGDTRQLGDYGSVFDAPMDAALSDAVMNCAGFGHVSIKFGPLNAFLSPSAAVGSFELLKSGIGQRLVIVGEAANTEPTLGDPAWAWMMEQAEFKSAVSSALVAINGVFPNASYLGPLSMGKPWGYMLHGETTETAVNTLPGMDDNNATASASGGILFWQLLSSNGTVTLKMQDATASNLNASFADVTGATSGSQDATTTPAKGFVQLAATAAVRKYLRPQIVFGTATTCRYVMAFSRNLP